MANKSTKRTKSITLMPIQKINCSGSISLLGLYDKKTQKVYMSMGHYVPDALDIYSINSLYEKLAERGIDNRDYKPFLCIPGFKKLHEETMKGVKPKYKEGDQVVIYEDVSRYKKRPVVYTVGEIEEIRTVCDRDGDGKSIVITRNFVSSEDNSISVFNENANIIKPLSELSSMKELEAIVKKIKKECKKQEMFGVMISYKGMVVEI